MEIDTKQRILGLDTGTNSLGWAVVDRLPEGYKLVDKGVHIFQEGVTIENGNQEKSRAAERTKQRSLRKQYWRRKLRKIFLLQELSNAGLCPPLSLEELHRWRVEGIYPLSNEPFMRWQRTDENKGVNPYAARCQCVERELDMENKNDRYLLGRALYHIAQRRGFLSNRKNQTDNKETGVVKEGIKELTQKINDAGCEYLCQYFYQLYQRGERIRSCYTDRKEHYEKEFAAICEKQHLNGALVEKLYKIIFVPRPPKKQNNAIAKCPFEPSKHCAPISHPLFEEFRMWSFIRNIKVQTPDDTNLRALSADEISKIQQLWYRYRKGQTNYNFHFEEIAKTLAGKGKYCYYKSAEAKPYRFNYYLDTNVAGSPVSAQLKDIFGENILQDREALDKIWNALDFYTDDVKLSEWGIKHYNLTDEQADKLAQMRLPEGYASLSLKAIENIMPLMRGHGLMYSSATLIAKLRDLLKGYDFDEEVDAYLINDIEDYLTIPTDKNGKPLMSREERKQILERKWQTHYNLSDKDLKKLYHPSMIEAYPKVENKKDGVYQLKSPRISALKNPMAMRSLFRIKAVVNQLLKEGTIDENTIVHIEFARSLNDANRRAALLRYQTILRDERESAREEIKKYVPNPTDDDILKYLLWKDQGGVSVYTGKPIPPDLLFKGDQYNFEHTVPRSMGGEWTRENLTICEQHFNTDIKGSQLPSQLSEQYKQIFEEQIQAWKDKYEDLDKQIRKLQKQSSGATTKEAKDGIIKKIRLLQLQSKFWHNKYEAFTIEEDKVKGFTRRQGTDISVINKYGRSFLQTLFERVDVVKGTMTAAFREVWDIQEPYEKKDRTNHVHHCIDAITIACMGKREYDKLSEYCHEEEENRHRLHGVRLPKPWPTFTEDIQEIEKEILVSHFTPNPMGKQTKKKLRDSRGHIIRDKGKQPIYAAGDTARVVLHNDKIYGKILNSHDIDPKHPSGKECTVKRIPLAEVKVNEVVDPVVKQVIANAIAKYGSIKAAIEAEQENQDGSIWLNKEKNVRLKKVRCFQDFASGAEPIRALRDISAKEYKRFHYSRPDGNYVAAIYEGTDNKGNRKRKSVIVTNLDAAKAFNKHQPLVPETSEDGYALLCTIKKGDLILLYENSPEELRNATQAELSKRLYKIAKMYDSGGLQITIRHHQEAREATKLKELYGNPKTGLFDNSQEIYPQRRLSYNQFNALVQGQHFELTETGKIVFK